MLGISWGTKGKNFVGNEEHQLSQLLMHRQTP